LAILDVVDAALHLRLYQSGWHPHAHILLLFEGCPSPVDYARLVTVGAAAGKRRPRITGLVRRWSMVSGSTW
jgi:hypothetical protein